MVIKRYICYRINNEILIKPTTVKQRNILTALFVGTVLMFASCTKEGPAGPAGTNGTNGTSGCIECHDNSQLIVERSLQWEASGHAMNGNFERNDVDCAPCHTSQGYLEILETGAQVTAAAISNPMPPNCYSCHKIHETNTVADWDLTATAPVKFWLNDVMSDQGTANTCLTCHQARIPDPLPVMGGTGTVTITSGYWGPHYGVQGLVFEGTGGYEVGTGYTNSKHSALLKNSCVDCHMAEPYGVQAGGHQMGMTYAYHGSDAVWTAGCVSCHADANALHTKIDNTVDEITVLYDSLGTILMNKGHLDATGHVVPGDYTHEEAGLMYNFRFVYGDHSMGIHNYDYVKTLLMNSIAAAK